MNRSQTALMRAMVGSGAHSRKRIMQVLRFIRPATCTISSRYLLNRAVHSVALRHIPRIALAML